MTTTYGRWKSGLGIIIAAALSFYSIDPSFAQSVADVLKTFRKLEASTEAGMTRNEYAHGMADVNAQLKSFSDTNQGRPTPETIKALTAAFVQYQKARAVWDEQEILDLRYQHGDVSIREYFGRKQEIVDEISGFWRAASAEIDRAAKLPRK